MKKIQRVSNGSQPSRRPEFPGYLPRRASITHLCHLNFLTSITITFPSSLPHDSLLRDLLVLQRLFSQLGILKTTLSAVMVEKPDIRHSYQSRTLLPHLWVRILPLTGVYLHDHPRPSIPLLDTSALFIFPPSDGDDQSRHYKAS